MRTIEIRHLGNFEKVVQRTEGKIRDAIGYLATWALSDDKTDHVEITVTSHDCEAAAYYSKAKGDQSGMLMVAVWWDSEKRYSFHT